MAQRKSSGPVEIGDLVAEVVRLARYVDSLQKSVERLAGRLEPFEGEKPPTDRPWLPDAELWASKHTLESIAVVVRQIHEQMRILEFDFNSVRGTMDQISKEAWSREDMKPYLDRIRRK